MDTTPDPDDPNVIIVHLRKRTLEEQVEYLLLQVSFMVAKIGTLERQAELLRARVAAVERATPLMRPKPPPPKLPPKRNRLD